MNIQVTLGEVIVKTTQCCLMTFTRKVQNKKEYVKSNTPLQIASGTNPWSFQVNDSGTLNVRNSALFNILNFESIKHHSCNLSSMRASYYRFCTKNAIHGIPKHCITLVNSRKVIPNIDLLQGTLRFDSH